jgi:hypothetical protein
MQRFVLVKLELTSLDLPLGVGCPILGLLLTFEMIADGGVALDTDNGPPDGGAVCVFTFKNRCHGSNLLLLGFGLDGAAG